MARKHIQIPQGGRIDTEYVESVYEKLFEKIPTKAFRMRLQD